MRREGFDPRLLQPLLTNGEPSNTKVDKKTQPAKSLIEWFHDADKSIIRNNPELLHDQPIGGHKVHTGT